MGPLLGGFQNLPNPPLRGQEATYNLSSVCPVTPSRTFLASGGSHRWHREGQHPGWGVATVPQPLFQENGGGRRGAGSDIPAPLVWGGGPGLCGLGYSALISCSPNVPAEAANHSPATLRVLAFDTMLQSYFNTCARVLGYPANGGGGRAGDKSGAPGLTMRPITGGHQLYRTMGGTPSKVGTQV